MRLISQIKKNFGKLLIIVGLLGGFWACYASEVAEVTEAAPPYNFLIIMTDDQRWDTLWAMPIVQEKLIKRGVNFTQAFVSTPLCCPSRASFLGGGYYAHNTGVLTNHIPDASDASAKNFVDTNTLPLKLQQNGYKTGLFGNYLNGYRTLAPYPYIPPGWSRFITRVTGPWTDFDAAIGASGDQSATGSVQRVSRYLTDYLRDEALSFLEEVGETPFFLYFAPTAPHIPATPAPEDEGLFLDYLYRGRGFGEEDVSDKPAHVRQRSSKYNVAQEDEDHRNQLRSLQAVDRAVGALVDKVEELGKLDSTLIVFTSDNGFHWGEHGLTQKGYPYEESIRVPLVVVSPELVPREDHSLVVANLDVPTTIWALAGLSPDTDGLSLLSLLYNPRTSWRPEGIFLEFWAPNPRHETWAGWRTRAYKYAEYVTGERELYDLVQDTYELENVGADPAYSHILAQLSAQTASLKGLAITVDEMPDGIVGMPYAVQVTAWGGVSPYQWTIVEGALPEGLALDSATGTLEGIPVRSQSEAFLVEVQDASITKQANRPQRFVKKFTLTIVAPGLLPNSTILRQARPGLPDADEEDEEG